jgi:hypothetical protein
MNTWEARVRKYEEEGMTRSDAQAVVDAEDQKIGEAGTKEAKRRRANASRRARNEAYKSAGMVRVRGNLGGTYWE